VSVTYYAAQQQHVVRPLRRL